MEISERKKQTLRYIVEAYISGGEPVGSKYLTDTKQLPWSSATIRNDMMELERCGYLSQPHTSAGRVPTTAGYQAYVNELMEEYKMTVKEVETINKLLSFKLSELDRVVHSIGKIASHMSNYTAVTLQTKQNDTYVKRFEIMRLDSKNMVLALITSADSVKSQHLRYPYDVTEADVASLKEALNTHLAGLTPENINLNVITKLERALGDNAALIAPIIRAVSDILTSLDNDDLEFEGVTNLLRYPELSENEALSGIINLPNKKNEMMQLLTDGSENAIQTVDGINIIIGSDNAASPIKDYSLIYKDFDAGGGLKGTLGIIGPKRMEYGKVVAHLKYLTAKLSELTGDEE